MNISGVIRESWGTASRYIKENKAGSVYGNKNQTISKTKDILEISDESRASQTDEPFTATSGKDTLGISKGNKENTYIIHFTDSAIVSRTVSRGYITVNGNHIELSEDTKKKLIETDKQAEADRMRAYNEYIMQHDMAVAQQQSETWKKATKDSAKALEIAAKLSSGKKITSSEAQQLMKFNPQLYAMAMSAAAMAKSHGEHQSTKQVKSDRDDYVSEMKNDGVEWSQFEWKTYESQMTVSLNGESKIEDVSGACNVINYGKEP